MHIIQQVEGSAYHQAGVHFAAVIIISWVDVSFIVNPEGAGLDAAIGFEVLQQVCVGGKTHEYNQPEHEC